MAIDLHVHSNASDGAKTPRGLVAEAARMGLLAISITDHDTVAGQAAGQAAGVEFGVQVIPGIEISADIRQAEAHILGYYIDYASDELQALTHRLIQGRVRRGRQMFDLLRDHAIKLDWDEVIKGASPEGFIGRGHLFRLMIAKGYVPEDKSREMFLKYFAKDGLAYVEHFYITPAEAIRAIRQAGGVPVLAHPGRMNDDGAIYGLVKEGIMGIEVFYPSHTPQQEAHYLAMARQLGLIATGGTDYHGHVGDRGVSMGGCSPPEEVLGQLWEAATKVRAGKPRQPSAH